MTLISTDPDRDRDSNRSLPVPLRDSVLEPLYGETDFPSLLADSCRFPECACPEVDFPDEVALPLGNVAGSAPIWLHVLASRANGLDFASS